LFIQRYGSEWVDLLETSVKECSVSPI
jgi:hypothetical protein